MNHAGISSNCTSCHNGQSFYGVTPVSKTSIHMTTGPGLRDLPQELRELHGRGLHPPGQRRGQCYTCHGSGQGGAMTENTSHVPTGAASCDTCHTSTAPGGFAIFSMGSTGHSATRRTARARIAPPAISGSYFGVMVQPSTNRTNPANPNCSDVPQQLHELWRGDLHPSGQRRRQLLHLPRHRIGRRHADGFQSRPDNGAQCDACHTSTATGGFATYTMGTTGHTAARRHKHDAGLHGLPCRELFRRRGQAVDPRCDQLELLDFGLPQQLHKLCGSDLHPSGLRTRIAHLPQHRKYGGRHDGGFQPRPDGCGVVQCLPHEPTVGGFASYTIGSVHSALGVTTGSTNCTSCHAASYFGVMVKPTSHIATTQDCSACHTNFTSFAGASYSHPASASGTCYTCHVAGNTMGAMVENTGHVATLSQSCDVCHKSTTAGGFATYTMGNTGHAALSVVLSTSNCMTCHNGTVFGTKTFKPHPGSHGTRTTATSAALATRASPRIPAGADPREWL